MASRRRKPRIPTVGTRGASLVRLNPEVRQVLHRQARRQARRLEGPNVKAARAERSPVRKAYRRNVRGARQAINLSEAELAAQTKALKGSGLKGRALRQTQREFSARSADLATSLPFLTSQARAQRQSDMVGVQQDINAAKASLAHERGQIYNSLIGTTMTQARSSVKARRSTTSDKSKAAKTAYRVAVNDLATGALNSKKKPGEAAPWAAGAIKHYGSEDAAWRRFEQIVAASEGVAPLDARKAVAALRKQIRQGKAPQALAWMIPWQAQ